MRQRGSKAGRPLFKCKNGIGFGNWSKKVAPRKRRKKTAPLPRRKPTRKPPELDDQLGGRGLNDDNLLELLNEESFFTKHKDRAKRILAPLSSL